jgi:hypothetical protein
MLFFCLQQGNHMLFGYQHKMYRRNRINVMKGENFIVLVHFAAWYFAARNFAK